MAQPSTDASNWFDVGSQDFVAASGTIAVNVVGNFLWLCVAQSAPVPIPGAPLLSNGTVAQVLYRC